MQIVYIGAFRFPTFDAAAARVLNIGRTLRDAGHEVIFISWGGKYFESPDDNGMSRYDGFKYYISGELNESRNYYKLRNKFSSGCQSINKLKQIISEVDLIIAYNPDWSFNKKLLRFRNQYGLKYAIDLTEWYDNNELKITDYIPNWLNMTRTNRTKVKNMILISSYLDKYYSRNHNIVIPATCNATDAKWNVARSIKGDRTPLSLIYAGNPAKKDKLHEIINAVERVEKMMPGKIRLTVLGIDKSTYISKYKPLLDNENLTDAIHFVGRVAQDDVPRYYAQADFMVLLRDATRKSNAGFPTKFAESMMSGTPVIANITSDLGQYLIDGHNGFTIATPTADALYDVLCDEVVCLKRDKMAELRINAKQIGLQFFDYRAYTKQMNDFLGHIQ